MGNLCSKSANEADPFAQPGRVLGNSSQPSSGPPPRSLTASTPGRALGGSESTTAAEDARSAAARAAEGRAAKSSKGAGKLSSQLEAQKKQTRNELLAASSEQERRTRDADEAAQARSYN